MVCMNSLFVFIAEYYSIAGMSLCLFNHSPIVGYSDCFQFGTVTNKAVLKSHV